MIVIRQPSTVEEYREGINLLSSIFQRRFQTFPRELPHQFFLAFDGENNNRVVGTINLQVARDGEPFEVERFFHCSVEELCGVARKKVGEIGRLTSLNELVTPYLFCAVGKFMEYFGIETFISFNKKAVGRILRSVYRLPLSIHEVCLREDVIPPEYYSYFFDTHNPVIILTGKMHEVEEWVKDLMDAQSGTIKIEVPSSMDSLDILVQDYSS